MLPLICNGISVNNCEGTSRHNDILGVVKHAVTALALDNPGLDSLKQGGVGIIIPDRGPVGWLGPQAVKKKLEPQKLQPKNSIDGISSG